MKKHLFIAALMLFASTSVFAQSTKTVVIKENNAGDEKITIVERVFTSRLHQTLPDLYYGCLNMLSGPFGSESNVPLRASSFEWGTYNQHTIISTPNNVFGMTWGLGISNSYNFLRHDRVLRVNDEGENYIQPLITYSSEEGHGPATNYAHRSFLRYWSLRLPIMMQVQWEMNNGYLALAAGVEAEWRFGVRSFAKYGGSKHLITDNLDYNPLGLNALFSLAGEDGVLFVRVGLTEMFKVKDVDNIYQIAIGLGLNID